MFRSAPLTVISGTLGLLCGCASGSTPIEALHLGLTRESQTILSDYTIDSVPAHGVLHLGCSEQALAETANGPGLSFRAAHPASENDRTDADDSGWHLDFAVRVSHTKLSETEQLLDRRLDIPLKFDFLHVFHRPKTPIDRKTNLELMSFFASVGRRENDYLVWNLYAGGGGAADRDHQQFAFAELDVGFKYGLYFLGVSAELYPWKVPQAADGLTWARRLRASRPYFTAGFETGYVSGEGKGDYTFGPITIYKDGVTVRDWTFSWPIGIGWSIPLNERWSYQLVGDYRFHLYRPYEYNSWNFTSILRRAL